MSKKYDLNVKSLSKQMKNLKVEELKELANQYKNSKNFIRAQRAFEKLNDLEDTIYNRYGLDIVKRKHNKKSDEEFLKDGNFHFDKKEYEKAVDSFESINGLSQLGIMDFLKWCLSYLHLNECSSAVATLRNAYLINKEKAHDELKNLLMQNAKGKKFKNFLHCLQKRLIRFIFYTEERYDLCKWGIKLDRNDDISWLNLGYTYFSFIWRVPPLKSYGKIRDNEEFIYMDMKKREELKSEAKSCFGQVLRINPKSIEAKKEIQRYKDWSGMGMIGHYDEINKSVKDRELSNCF